MTFNMELTNATLYHFRDGRRVNKNWTVGNTFTVDSNYRNYICGDIKPIDANLSIVNVLPTVQFLLTLLPSLK